ncbi:hypothetical protein [Calothrix sp. NIES-3974]|uniref:hypothetical protein n=1 Tax=Calothrix sp. NIES-3974 TaxID=2005462 RepID=UPI000B61B3E7|nr:hypothetical protein [Calothrix sp. NIES-3974]BAZ05861.1 hypothetical protein NIES3974_25160 [Calothrix sp. NIES-3974]
MLGFVKNIINRSGEKKDGGFYLQLDETGNVVETNTPSQPATPAVKPEEKEVQPAAATTETPVAEKKKSGKTSIKKAKSEAKPKTTEPVAATPVATVKPATPPEPQEKNFATKYLTTTNTMSRRRPGANMNSFLEMARQVKVPINK